MYDYRCLSCGHRFRKFYDGPFTICPECGYEEACLEDE